MYRLLVFEVESPGKKNSQRGVEDVLSGKSVLRKERLTRAALF